VPIINTHYANGSFFFPSNCVPNTIGYIIKKDLLRYLFNENVYPVG